MLVNGLKINLILDKDEVLKFGLMALYMKVTGFKMKLVDAED